MDIEYIEWCTRMLDLAFEAASHKEKLGGVLM